MKRKQSNLSDFERNTKKNLKNKKYRVYILLIILFILAIFLVISLVNNIKTKKEIEDQKINIIQEQSPELGINDSVDTENNNQTQIETTPKIIANKITESSTLDEINATGKPSFIVFAGTYCGHCRTLVPELETEIWDNYADRANIWINVIDGKDGEKFEVNRIAQGFNPYLDYSEIMGDCGYVPAYVVLDKTGNQILRSCGGEKTIAEVKAALDSQLN